MSGPVTPIAPSNQPPPVKWDRQAQIINDLHAKRSRPVRFPQAKKRRDEMRRLEICINGSYSLPPKPGRPPRRPSTRPMIEHGKPVKAGKCQRCCDLHDGKSVAS